MFFRRGYSLNKISNTLRNKGIDRENIKLSIEKIKEEKNDPDFTSAMKICKKRRIGPVRPQANRELFYKNMVFNRSGFSFEISKKVLNIKQKNLIN